jgi:hypothetical protein
MSPPPPLVRPIPIGDQACSPTDTVNEQRLQNQNRHADVIPDLLPDAPRHRIDAQPDLPVFEGPRFNVRNGFRNGEGGIGVRGALLRATDRDPAGPAERDTMNVLSVDAGFSNVDGTAAAGAQVNAVERSTEYSIEGLGSVRLGTSLGLGGQVRIHHGDDGIGQGIDFGPVSLDARSELPHRLWNATFGDD